MSSEIQISAEALSDIQDNVAYYEKKTLELSKDVPESTQLKLSLMNAYQRLSAAVAFLKEAVALKRKTEEGV